MAWSYRQDRIDELYSDEVGVTLVKGKTLPESPESPEDAEDMLKPPAEVPEPKDEKDIDPKGKTLTQFQEHPGQNVPRMIVGKGSSTKDLEIVKATKAVEDRKKKSEGFDPEVHDRERARIMAEEQQKAHDEELEKERDKIRKDVQQEIKKDDKKESAHANAKK